MQSHEVCKISLIFSRNIYRFLCDQAIRSGDSNRCTAYVPYQLTIIRQWKCKAITNARAEGSRGVWTAAACRWASCLASRRWTVICTGMPPVTRWKAISGGNANDEGAMLENTRNSTRRTCFEGPDNDRTHSRGSWYMFPSLGGSNRGTENANICFRFRLQQRSKNLHLI